jgi:hypothetical protein
VFNSLVVGLSSANSAKSTLMTAPMFVKMLNSIGMAIKEDDALAILRLISWHSTGVSTEIHILENWLCHTISPTYRAVQQRVQVSLHYVLFTRLMLRFLCSGDVPSLTERTCRGTRSIRSV